MTISNQVKQMEAHIKTLASTKKEQCAIISQVQAMLDVNCQEFAIITIAKRRIIRN